MLKFDKENNLRMLAWTVLGIILYLGLIYASGAPR